MRIPTATQQEHKVTVVNGKPRFYEPAEVKAARQKYMSYLSGHVPATPIDGPIRLMVKFCFSGGQGWKTTKPDTDNMIKMMKDCMTRLGYWHDDAQVCSEIVEKFYDTHEGVYVRIDKL
jgi:Holliday junction resolvase RusA-like endonuclease